MISSLASWLVSAGAMLLLPQAATAQVEADPMVLLDEAKMVMADGKLEYALEKLTELEPAGEDPLIDQEILFQQMLLNSAFLAATHFLLEELAEGKLASSPYGSWLAQQRRGYLEEFTAISTEFLDATEDVATLDFVRFRLPRVTDEYLEDAGLYADAQVLSAAVTNFDDGRDGLGRGVVVAQARVALVLFAAEYYDLPDAAGSLELAADRLRDGVPVEESTLLYWLAGISREVAGSDEELLELADHAKQRARQRGYTRSAFDHPEPLELTDPNSESSEPSL